MVCAALLGIREILHLKDLKSTILLDEREDAEGVVVKRVAIGGRPHSCELHMIFESDPKAT